VLEAGLHMLRLGGEHEHDRGAESDDEEGADADQDRAYVASGELAKCRDADFAQAAPCEPAAGDVEHDFRSREQRVARGRRRHVARDEDGREDQDDHRDEHHDEADRDRAERVEDAAPERDRDALAAVLAGESAGDS
jgi:hypothetical protein